MHILKRLIGITLIALVIISLFSLWGFYSAIHPANKLQSTITPDQLGVRYTPVSFKTKDDVWIQGWFIPSVRKDAKTIILLHGYPADKGDILSSRLFLHPEFNLLFLDFRFLGQSEGKYTSLGANEVFDIEAAVSFLKNKGITEVGIWGLSMGASTALLAAKKVPEIKAIVAESGFARLDKMLYVYYPTPILQYPLAFFTNIWAKVFLGIDVDEVSPMEAIKNLKIPILIIHSKLDSQIPFEHAEWLQSALKNNPHAQYLFTNDLGHGQINVTVQEKIKSFFENALNE